MTIPVQAQKYIESPDVAAISLYQSITKNLRSDFNKLVYKTVIALKDETADTATIEQSLRMTRAGARLGDDTIQALVFLVIMEAANDERENLKAIMASARSQQDEKRKIRTIISQQQKVNVANLGVKYKTTADVPVAEYSELSLLKMQMAMERLAHMYTALSNIMKSQAESIKNAIANIK